MPRFLHASSVSALTRAFYANDGDRTAEHVLSLTRQGYSDVLSALVEHPLEDDWKDFVYKSLSSYFSHARGYVYVVANPTQPGFQKVGQTGRTPALRLAELNNEAVIGQFILVDSWQVYDRHHLEKAAHLAMYDLPRHKEFFHSPWQLVCERVAAALAADRRLLEAASIPLPEL